MTAVMRNDAASGEAARRGRPRSSIPDAGSRPAIAPVLAAAADALRAAIAGVDREELRIEAEVLLAHAMRLGRSALLAHLRDPLDDAAAARFEALLARRVAREPLAYITGSREFYGIAIECAPGALIPRPETEMLVELALARCASVAGAVCVADAGTGCGAIAVAVALNAPDADVAAIDRSSAARAIAQRNIERHHVGDRVALAEGDLLEGQGRFDVVVANLPYVSEAGWRALPPEIREHEPCEALVAGEHGIEIIERMLSRASEHLEPGGLLALEIGATQGEALLAIARRRFPDAEVYVMKDLAGLDRVLVVRTQGGCVDEKSLREAVEAQARARISGDEVTFASCMTPQALLAFNRNVRACALARRPWKMEIIAVSVEGATATSSVRYFGGGSALVRSTWERRGDHWTVVSAEIPVEEIRVPWYRRILGAHAGAREARIERRDLG